MGYLQQALVFDPNNTDLLNNFAIASYYQGKQSQSLQALQKALGINKHPTLLYNIGVLAARADDSNSAKEWFTQYKHLTTQKDWLRNVSRQGYLENDSRRPQPHIEYIGSIKPGMTLDKIKQTSKLLGEHKSYIENLPILTEFDGGISALSEGGLVLVAVANESHTGKSARGISIGSRKEDVVSLYGEPTETIHTSSGNCLKFDDQKISFFINNNKVSKWLVHLSP
jgi:hypothetical protein